MKYRSALFVLVAWLGLSLFGRLVPPTGAAAQTTVPEEAWLENGYHVVFDGVDYHDDGTSTWTYTVEELPNARNLGYWVLEIPPCAPVVEAGPEHWEVVDPDEHTRLSGVKWDVRGNFRRGQFSVTVETTGEAGVRRVAARGGPDVGFGEIAGPTCADPEPPEPVDTEPPTIEWVGPVGPEGRYTVQEGETINLVVTAADNDAVDRVTFMRWDAVDEVYVTLATDADSPYQTGLPASELRPDWNYIVAASFDPAGNRSEWEFIWLYRPPAQGNPQASTITVFIPLVQR